MIATVDLEQSLRCPCCPKCKSANIWPAEVQCGGQLLFRCSDPRCSWVGVAPLPPVKKIILYLDTSTVSNIARVREAEEKESAWMNLYETLKTAIASEALCCVVSSIVREEAEESPHGSHIVAMARELCNQGVRHAYEVRHCQLVRVLRRFLKGDPPKDTVRPPARDAFRTSIEQWQPSLRFTASIRTPQEFVDDSKRAKAALCPSLDEIYGAYEADGFSFHEMVAQEAKGLGESLVQVGVSALRQRTGLEPIQDGEKLLLQNTFDILMEEVRDAQGIDDNFECARIVTEFLRSEHFFDAPIVRIQARLFTALAVEAHGSRSRVSRQGDAADVRHVSTFIPYVDILITDRSFALLCNKNNMRIGDRYSTTIRSLGPGDVPEFISEIDKIVETAPQTKLARKIDKLILKGRMQGE